MNRGERILVVDDKQSFRFMIQGYLEDAGYLTTLSPECTAILES